MADRPYPGLRAFQKDEVDIFFGREKQVDTMVEKLASTRFLAVVGPSGCGKSSLVLTGLQDALENGFLAEAGTRWIFCNVCPGDKPLKNLAEAIVDKDSTQFEESDKPYILATLERGPLGIIEFLHYKPLRPEYNLLIVVDQFEEIFRYVDSANWESATAFVEMLLLTSRLRQAPVYIVITMRSDFLGDCVRFDGLPEAINEGQYLTPRLSRFQLKEAIEGPSRVFGGHVDPKLTNQLLNDMGSEPDQLPLMQHVLLRLWSKKKPEKQGAPWRLTLDDYKSTEGLRKELSAHADEVLEYLGPGYVALAERMFRALTERQGADRDIRRPMKLIDLSETTGAVTSDLQTIIDAYRAKGRTFINPPIDTPLESDSIIDIVHESLIRQWVTLQKWISAEKESEKIILSLSDSANRWSKGKGELLRELDLDNALDWQKREYPTPRWASRYIDNFEEVVAFLKRSTLEASNKKRQEQRDRLTRISLYGALPVAVALGIIINIYWRIYSEKVELESANIDLKVELNTVLHDAEPGQIARFNERKENDENQINNVGIPVVEPSKIKPFSSVDLEEFCEIAGEHASSIDFNPGSGTKSFRKGRQFFKQRDYNTAEGLFRDALRVNRGVPRGYRWLGWSLLQQSKVQEAETSFKAAACLSKSLLENELNQPVDYKSEVYDDNYYSYSNLAKFYEKNKDVYQAASYLKKAIEFQQKKLAILNSKDKRSAYTMQKLASNHTLLGDYEKMLTRHQESLLNYKEAAKLWKLLAEENKFGLSFSAAESSNLLARTWATNSGFRDALKNEISLDKAMEYAVQAYNYDGAEAQYAQTLAILECLKKNYDSAEYHADEAVSLIPAEKYRHTRDVIYKCRNAGDPYDLKFIYISS